MARDTILFDTHAAIEELADAGVPRQQATAHVSLTARLFQENVASKADFQHLELTVGKQIAEVRAEIADLRTEVRTEIAKVRTEIAEVRTEVANLETRITEKFDALKSEISDRAFDTLKWTAGMQIGTILAIIAAIKLL
ncbi:MAG: DUF1640 domain-containing protein [Defluviicoccus sp.]|nr:DUF1640 domain-containing protein [Defluviicoccus sp.]MDE0274470.1 DUF1640 domain-containing protein [Defluviicoccus sp.]